MTRVITYGTFDLFHFGHLEILRRAKELGDYLIVAVSTDEFNEKQKNKQTVYCFEHRSAIVAANKYVDQVIPETNWDQKLSDIQNYNIDILVMGDDWKGKFDFQLAGYCKTIYLPRTQGISSTGIKEEIRCSVHF